jgi:O-antigen biosynthesis protein
MIRLPQAERPLVSVIVVTFGGWDLVERALRALADHTSLPFETIVVDNGSPDGTGDRVREEVTGARVLLNGRNVGFGPANNQGAGMARGRFLVLLNPDALVRPGWLPPLVEVLEEDPRAGAVVPLLLNEDGTVQEAGSLLFSDGSTLALGAGADASDPAYRFRRVTDYGSAACLAMRRSDFAAVGGFDPAYLPAYVEDVDLQLALRAQGLRTVYQPRSEVVHARFSAAGRTEGDRLIERNREVLRRRWAAALAELPPPVPALDSPVVVAARDRKAVDRVLVVGEADGILTALADRFPEGRITGLGTVPDPGLLALGIEVLPFPEDPDGWFRARRFHYSAAILLGPGAQARSGGHLDEHQPQALRIYDMGPGTGSGNGPRQAEMEALARADAVLCRTPAQRVLAETVGRDAVACTEARVPPALVAELGALGLVGAAGTASLP